MEAALKVLFLSPYPERLADVFAAAGDDVTIRSDKISAADVAGFDWLVSYGYRHILKKPVLDVMPRRAINLHISFLPYNKGAHPNYWAWAEGTPSGVTIHEIDAGIDTGPIIAQRMVCMSRSMTFAESYKKLHAEIATLFRDAWPTIRTGEFESFPQVLVGSFHYAKELPGLEDRDDVRISERIQKSRGASSQRP